MSGPLVVELTATQTHQLRRAVLRDGTPNDDVRFDGDELPDTVHLGILHPGILHPGIATPGIVAPGIVAPGIVAVSSWISCPHPDHPALRGVQLRGMATAPAVRGSGLGSVLLLDGLDRMRVAGVDLVWARARDTALGFYERHGFARFGHGYVDLTTGLPHHDIVLRL